MALEDIDFGDVEGEPEVIDLRTPDYEKVDEAYGRIDKLAHEQSEIPHENHPKEAIVFKVVKNGVAEIPWKLEKDDSEYGRLLRLTLEPDASPDHSDASKMDERLALMTDNTFRRLPGRKPSEFSGDASELSKYFLDKMREIEEALASGQAVVEIIYGEA